TESKWMAPGTQASSRESRAAQPSGGGRSAASPRRTPRNKVGLINVATGEKVEFENMRSFAFSGEAGSWLALHKYPPEGRTPQVATPAATGGPSPFGPPSPPAQVGADLLLHELATGSELNLGNVSEFVFDKKGQWLALVIDAQGQSGNGVQLRNMTTGALLPLDSAKATYRRLNWTEKGDAFAVLRGTTAKASTPPAAASGSSLGIADPGGDNRQYVVVGFTDLSDRMPHKVVYDPKNDSNFPKDMAISSNRSPTWTEDLGGLLFGIYQPKQKPETAAPKIPDKTKPKPGTDTKTAGKAPEPPRDKPDLVIWHWSDDRLQSQQERSAGTDRNFSYLCIYRVKEKKF